MTKIVECPQCGNPVYVFRNPVPTVDVIIESPKGVLLIQRRNPPDGWAFPGGFVDYGETIEDAVVREAKEETGLDVTDVRQFHCYSHPGRDPRQHTVTVVFSAKASGKLQAADDAADARYFAWDDLPGEMAFDHRQILEDYRSDRWGSN